MKKYYVLSTIAGLFFAFTLSAQPRGGDPDMENYRMRNAGFQHGGGGGWGGGGVNVHSTGATIGGGGISGWNSRDGLGPVVTHQNSNNNWNNNNNNNNNYHTNISGWRSQDGLGPVVTHQNSNNNWNGGNSNWNNNNSFPHSSGIHVNPNSPLWGNGGGSGWQTPSWSSSWGNIGSGGGGVTINNFYNSGSWWRDFRNPPPGGMQQIGWGGHNYYYHDGNFFNIINGIYSVVLPVLGMILNSIPSGATPMANYSNYYYYHGVYYYYTGSGYRVCSPPIGACLSSLPYFATPTVIDGISCYKYDNIFIQPTYNVDGTFCYRVVGSIY